MSNFEKANDLASKWVESMGGLEAVRHDYGSDLSGLMQALDDAGLLAPDVRIIRKLEELEKLDPDTLVGTHGEIVSTTFGVGHILATAYLDDLMFPMVVIATGDQVRDAREVMELDNG